MAAPGRTFKQVLGTGVDPGEALVDLIAPVPQQREALARQAKATTVAVTRQRMATPRPGAVAGVVAEVVGMPLQELPVMAALASSARFVPGSTQPIAEAAAVACLSSANTLRALVAGVVAAMAATTTWRPPAWQTRAVVVAVGAVPATWEVAPVAPGSSSSDIESSNRRSS